MAKAQLFKFFMRGEEGLTVTARSLWPDHFSITINAARVGFRSRIQLGITGINAFT